MEPISTGLAVYAGARLLGSLLGGKNEEEKRKEELYQKYQQASQQFRYDDPKRRQQALANQLGMYEQLAKMTGNITGTKPIDLKQPSEFYPTLARERQGAR